MGQRLVNARLATPFCCFRFEERILSLGLLPSVPGRQLVQERGRRLVVDGVVGEIGWGDGMSVYRSHLSQESCRRSALSTSGSVLNVIERQLKWR